MKIAIAQINPTVGDLVGNCQNIVNFCHKAKESNASLVIFPELSLLGYPPKDLLLRDDFLDALPQYHEQIAKNSLIPVIFGTVIKRESPHLPYNCALLCQDGQIKVVAQKILLPNYNVFDEKRYFSSPVENACQVLEIFGTKILISICEDAWNSWPALDLKYSFDPIALGVKKSRPNLILNMSASPFTQSKPKTRENIFTNLAKTYGCPVMLSGQVGANDQLLFDGHSMVIDQEGHILKRARPCQEDLLIFDLEEKTSAEALGPDPAWLLREVLVMGIRDYVNKCRAPGVIIGLSGGIDSAVCLALAVLALGKEKVRAVFLPSRFSSDRSFLDAQKLSDNLEINLEVLPIEKSADELRALLQHQITPKSPLADIADQNLQSRLRGLIIMALSNSSNYLMLATSNKSELSVGYSTIYGDMCGAFSPIGDLYKGQVYELAHTINRSGMIIPTDIISRAPTAELKAEQLDCDSLPPYEILDKILFNFIELEKNPSEIATLGIDIALINDVIAMVNRSEYKRRQGPFPLMVSDKVFGDARRLPIAKRL